MHRIFFKFSKSIHRYTGLFCLVWFLLLGISGILINHPDLIRGLTVPAAFVPTGFNYQNWNHMALREVIYSQNDPNTLFLCGRKGVWKSRDRGQTFSSMANGYPSSAFEKDTHCLLLMENHGERKLYAGNRAGLFSWNFDDKIWVKICQKGIGRTAVKDLIVINGSVMVFTSKNCFRLEDPGRFSVAVPQPLEFKAPPQDTASMIKFMVRIHDGTILGLPGKIFVDVMGGGLSFLSLSALWLWYIPERRKKGVRRGHDIRLYRFCRQYHLKLGIWCLFFILVITFTGMIIRRPFRHLIADDTVPSTWLKNNSPAAGHGPQIRRAVFLAKEDTVLLGTRGGFFKGPADFSTPFVPSPMGVPVSGMGTNVMENLSGNRVLIGSFEGLYYWDIDTGCVTDAVENMPLIKGGTRSKFKNRAVGAGVKEGQLQFWADYRMGIALVGNPQALPTMPVQIENNTGMSLWRFMRVLHTGHIFKTWFGRYTWLIVPVGGLLLMISLFTGGYDWFYRKRWV